MGLFVTNTKPFKCAGRALLLVMVALMATGCANKPAFKPADVFQQAMNVQKQEQAHASPAQTSLIAPAEGNRLEWQFAANTHELTDQQRIELYGLLQHVEVLENYRLSIEIGPDWLSSYKRGNSLRPFVPRGLSIQQHYRAQMAPHSLVLTLEQKPNEVRYEQ
ncbi:hypothetical protein [Bacterioplanoides sp.]|uniref:hypothetical protein n=1 Tax=Bacterioplanoides sp. TaxID=2066072 RepID=UPI003B00411B